MWYVTRPGPFSFGASDVTITLMTPAHAVKRLRRHLGGRCTIRTVTIPRASRHYLCAVVSGSRLGDHHRGLCQLVTMEIVSTMHGGARFPEGFT